MPAIKRGDLTMSDMVVLCLLAERPMHGHQASLELARRKLRRWTGVSRPQVYWSLNKLEKMGLICAIEIGDVPPPRQRRVFTPTIDSGKALEKSLGRKYWTTQSARPLFLAWMLLAHDLPPELLRRQVRCRANFIEGELTREKNMRRLLRKEDQPQSYTIDWVMGLNIDQLESELRWLRKWELRASCGPRGEAERIQRKVS
jgi:DNA-binding PadR family transcriptional regulator